MSRSIFAGETANFFSPIPIPRRIRQGPKHKRPAPAAKKP